MTFKSFSPKQKLALSWWGIPKYRKKDAVICDGAVRSGKTLCMSMGFVSWAMSSFSGNSFALCGKTVSSLRRNLVEPLAGLLGAMGFNYIEKVSKNYIDISLYGRKNRFYLFGGRDESSAALIQGMTLSGILMDEVALMPRSFVEQAMARCSVSGSKMWFNCNPDNPYHWFYREWIKKSEEKNALYIHFTMKDNPSLSGEIRKRYEKLYSGVFYDRFILGKWTPQAAGFTRCSAKAFIRLKRLRIATDLSCRAITEQLIRRHSDCGGAAEEFGTGWRNIIMIPEEKGYREPTRSITAVWRAL